MTKNSKYLPLFVCILGSMFYLYEFVLQVSPSVITHHLMQDFGVGAAGVSIISAFFYYAYTPTQIIAGLSYDKFGPRRVLTGAILICVMGTFLFASAHNLTMAATGRLLMGMGSAFSFIGALMLVSRWFPPSYFALLAGLVQLMSSIGAISGQIPIAKAVEIFGWRSTLFWVAIFGLLLAVLVYWIVKDYPPEKNIFTPKHVSNESRQVQNFHKANRLKTVLGKAQTWFIGIYAFAAWGPIVIFAALWGIPYLEKRFDLTSTGASTACAMIWLGIGIGSPLLGGLGDLIRNRRVPLVLCGLFGLISGLGVLYLHHITLPMLYILLFIFGLGASGQAVSFAVIQDVCPKSMVGTAIGFNNMLVVIGGAILQPLSGFILHHQWSGQYLHGVPFYSVANYISAMSIIPFCSLLCLITSIFFIKETYAQKVYEG